MHAAPDAAVGGPLALVHGGDSIALDVEQGSLSLLVADAELKACRAQWQSGTQVPARGYERLFVEHVTQADEDIDFDFLAGAAGAAPLLAEAGTTRRCCNRQLVEEGFACDNTSAFGNLMIDASRLVRGPIECVLKVRM